MTGGFGGPGSVICALIREASASTAGRRLYILRVLLESRTAGGDEAGKEDSTLIEKESRA